MTAERELSTLIRCIGRFAFSRQHPDGGDTPGVAAAPVPLAGVIVAGFARFIVTLWLHAAEFGVGMTVMFGSMLVPPNSVITG
jgi:hypothetical protein